MLALSAAYFGGGITFGELEVLTREALLHGRYALAAERRTALLAEEVNLAGIAVLRGLDRQHYSCYAEYFIRKIISIAHSLPYLIPVIYSASMILCLYLASSCTAHRMLSFLHHKI